MSPRSQRYQAEEVMTERIPRRYFFKAIMEEKDMSSGKLKRHDGFNPIQIKDGQVVRVNKNGTVRSILGTIRDMKKNKDEKK